MQEFLKQYSEQWKIVEEEKLKLLKEMKEEKAAFFNPFFDYMEKHRHVKRAWAILNASV